MEEEYKSLLHNSTWRLFNLLAHRTPIGYKWVFKIKRNVDGSINRYKASLFVKGFHHNHSFDFKEIFSSVVKPPPLLKMLFIAISKVRMGYSSTNGKLHEEVYVSTSWLGSWQCFFGV